MQVRLEAEAINRSPRRQEISHKLLEQRKSVVVVIDYPVVVDIQQVGGVSLLHVFVYLGSYVRVSAVVNIESVIILALVHHLVNNVPVLHSESIKMVESLVHVFVDSESEVLLSEGPGPVWIVLDFVPEQRVT